MNRLLYLSTDPGVPVLGHKGASVHLREMVAAFSAAGVSVVVASPRVGPEGASLGAPAELAKIDPVQPARHPTVGSLRRALAAQALQVEAIARAHGVDAIYERYSLFGASGVLTANLLGVPHALEVNAPLREEAHRFRSLPHPEGAAKVESRVFAGTDQIFAVSEALARGLVEEEVDAAKISVAANGVDPSKFAERLPPSGRAFTVGFAGSLKPWHGVHVLLSAFRRALLRRPELRLEIIGSGPGVSAVQQANLPAERFAYHGPLPHHATIAVMSAWNVGVAPFLPIPGFYFSPLKVVEYMAAGICPVASDLGQIRSFLGGGERGVLVEPGNAEALAEALLQLDANPIRAAELGARARAYAVRSLTWRRNAERALTALQARSAGLAA